MVAQGEGASTRAQPPSREYCLRSGSLSSRSSCCSCYKTQGKRQSVDLVLESKPLKWVFKRAARTNAQRLILVGNSEWQRGMVSVKILSSGEQYEIKLDELE
ncbi:Histidine--tRNA ligase, chloroplastic/mitochondrial [Vitis vinifera]|uniref:histidine--tRNA ligase n=1 Tax=Vitis vinifera TaxID=29760 RepID=A0A438J7F0_VITVI|nr:Histidine--tRNA ligase, chloroplastic/mitochondrial [Vitis vinifera]